MASKYLEPLPESDWHNMPEWLRLKRDLLKNLALYNQQKDDLPSALDNLRQAIFIEKALDENSVFLHKLGRYAEAIDFSIEAISEVDRKLGIDRKKSLASQKYSGKVREVLQERE
jgi:hypothetical protein